MSPNLDKELCSNFPAIMAERRLGAMQTAMCWGFDHDDGWYNILATAMKMIQSYIDMRKRLGVEVEQVVFEQVKEKFGTLRFYMDGYNDKISAYESFAEAMSARTCEDCGSPGKTRYEGWYRTLCDKHAVEQGYEIDLVNLEETDYVPFGAEDKTGE